MRQSLSYQTLFHDLLSTKKFDMFNKITLENKIRKV